MAKKLLLNLINGVLLVSFCSMGKVVGAVSRSLREKGDIDLDERKVMRGLYFEKETKSGDEKYVQPKKSNRARSVPQDKKVTQPSEQPQISLPPPPQKETREVVPVLCSKRVLDVYNLSDYSDNDLWQVVLDLIEEITKTQNWCDSKGEKSLVYHLAELYKTANQNIRDAIALYFLDTSGCCIGELAGDDDDAEQDAIDFVSTCLAAGKK